MTSGRVGTESIGPWETPGPFGKRQIHTLSQGLEKGVSDGVLLAGSVGSQRWEVVLGGSPER